MNKLPSKTTLELIQSLESGSINPTQAAQRIAQAHAVKTENYSQTLITGIILSCLAWAVTGGAPIIPGVIAFLTWDTYQTQRQNRLQSFKHISQGQILEYLPDADRELFSELLSETQSQSDIQNSEDQDAPRSQTETQTQQPIQDSAAAQTIKTDIATHFLDNLRCTFLCAPPRTGKGVVAAAMMNGFKKRFPRGWLGSCTIKQFKGEAWYWQWSDRHINPSLEDDTNPIAAAKSIYSLYRDWTTSPSNAANPSLLVIDELKDTLLRLEGVTMGEVTSDYPNPKKGFTDWLREQLLSSATMNQCHARYVLLIAPVNTAKALTFKDASSLQSYAAYVLTTPSDLSFTKAGNSAFSAPTISPDDERFSGWYGLGWSTKGNQWLGIPIANVEEAATYYGSLWTGSSPVQTSEPGSKSGSNSEPGSSFGSNREPDARQALEACFQNSVHGSNIQGSDREPGLNRLEIVRELNRGGLSQAKIIELLWNVKKGGTQGYKDALDEYRAIVEQLNSDQA